MNPSIKRGRVPSGIASIAIFVLLCHSAPAADAVKPHERPLWLAVGPAELIKAVEPLAAHRREQGMETLVVAGSDVAEALAKAPRRPTYLLLVGDDLDDAADDENRAAWLVPAKRHALYRWIAIQKETFASDAAWGDFDGDSIPDACVGRIPARTAEEVELVVAKTLAFEKRAVSGDDLRMGIWAGSPDYGEAFDSTSTALLLSSLKQGAPRFGELRIIAADLKSPLCGWPADQPAEFTRTMKRGGLCHVLLGHGSVDQFFSMHHGPNGVWYEANDAQKTLANGDPTPPMIVFACDCGQFNGSRASLAESFLFFRGGPVVTIAATTQSHPLTNFHSGQSLLETLPERPPTIGMLWLAAQKRAMNRRNFLVDAVLLEVEGKLEPELDTAKLRRDQMLMYALLGDPATQLRLPLPLEAEVSRAGEQWNWRVERPAGATRLLVGFRPADAEAALTAPRPEERDGATKAFEAANAAFGFETVAEFDGEQEWTGEWNQPGTLRLVALGPNEIYAAVVELE